MRKRGRGREGEILENEKQESGSDVGEWERERGGGCGIEVGGRGKDREIG